MVCHDTDLFAEVSVGRFPVPVVLFYALVW